MTESMALKALLTLLFNPLYKKIAGNFSTANIDFLFAFVSHLNSSEMNKTDFCLIYISTALLRCKIANLNLRW